MILIQAIRNAMVNDLVVRNVADRSVGFCRAHQQIADAAGHASTHNRGRVPAPAPASYATAVIAQSPAVREQREDQRGQS